MKYISLTQGQFAAVDDEDFEWLSQWKWRASFTRNTRSFYATRTVSGEDGKRFSIYLHREILGLKKGDKRQCDHINHDTLDNRRENLRMATPGENMLNRRKPSNNTSGFKGVLWNKGTGSWLARIRFGDREVYLGLFESPQLAHAAYCRAAEKFHGEFARFA